MSTSNKFKNKCILCGSTENKFVFNENGYDLMRCIDCSLFFINPMPTYDKNYTDHFGKIGTDCIGASEAAPELRGSRRR